MERSTFFAFLLIASIGTASAQEPTLKQLLELRTCKSFDCANDFATQQGFCFTGKTEGQENYEWFSCDFIQDDGLDKLQTKNNFTFLIGREGTRTVYGPSYGTSTLRYFQKLSAEVKELGFVATKTTQISSTAVLVNYTSPSYPGVLLAVTTARALKQGYEWTTWTVGFTITDGNN